MSQGMTEVERRRFNQMSQERAARQQATEGVIATQALEGRDLESFQRVQAERARRQQIASAAPWETTRMLVKSEDLGEPGLPDLDVRASLSFRETRQERQEAFKRTFPMGELQPAVTERGETFDVFRRDTAEPWRRLDPGPFERFEPAQDVADIAGDVPEMVGEAVTTRGTGGIIKMGARAGLGAMSGTAAEELVEWGREEQRQDLPSVVGTMGGEGAAAALGTVATAPISGIANMARGARNAALLPGAHAAIEAEMRQDLPPLTAAQLVANPMLRRTATYGETFSSSMQLYVMNQRTAAADRIKQLDISGASDAPLYTRAGVQSAEGRFLELLERPRTNLSRDWQAAGTQVMEGAKEWDRLARLEVDDLHNAARRIEEPNFNLDDLDGATKLALTEQMVAPDGKLRPMIPENSPLFRVLKDIEGFDGQPRTVTLPDGSQGTLSVTDQLRSFRQRLYDLKTPAPGTRFEQIHGDAAHFYNLLTNTLKNPANNNPAFLAAWSNANDAAARRFRNWDQLEIQTIDRAQDPDKLAAQFVAPGNRHSLQLIKTTIPVENWEPFRQSAIEMSFLRNPQDITKNLQNWDMETLTTFMQPREIAALREIGENIDKLAPLRDLIDQPRWQDMGRTIMNAPDARYAVAAEEIGGKYSPSGMRLRAATLNAAIAEVIEEGSGGVIVNRTKLNTVLQRLRTNGATDFLTDTDIQVLEDVHRYIDLAGKDAADMGASLMGSQQQLSAFREFSIGALANILQTIYIGELLISPAGRRMLVGRDAPKGTYQTLRLLGAATGTLLTTFEEDPEDVE